MSDLTCELLRYTLSSGGAPVLLRNAAAHGNHSLGVKLAGKKANPDGIGARITWQAGDLKRSRLKTGGGSFLSAHDPREVLGIANRTKIDKLEIRWPQPSGRADQFTDVPVDRYITIVEGSGIKCSSLRKFAGTVLVRSQPMCETTLGKF